MLGYRDNYKFIPTDVIRLVLQLAGEREIYLFQDTYPELLKYVIVYDLDKINNKENYKYINSINTINMTNITNNDMLKKIKGEK